jgi:hypothetical protein
MELPEQDRQALIEAARRRGVTGKGGAAFGVMPSSGKRPERLNVSRDVNMPAQLARGWAAGTLGLPGDIESLGRMGINLVKPGAVAEESFLPTSEFYQEYLPGGDERPAAKFASGLGALGGGMGSTAIVRGAGKGAKAVGKAIAPKVGEMAQQYMHASGMAPQLTAYHGTPHKFSPEEGAPLGKFKAEKIGTGEGAQAYGHGIYFAESPGVAEDYRNVLGSPRNMVAKGRGVYIEPSPMGDGKYMLATRSETGKMVGTAGDATQFIYPDKTFNSLADAMRFAKKKGLIAKEARPQLVAINEDGKYVPIKKAADVEEPQYSQFIAADKGSLYTVDIPDEMIPRMLDWDKPLSQQPEVMEALKNVEGVQYADKYFKANKKADPTGEDIHEFLRLSGYNPNQIAPAMREAGIPGIKYLDQQSRPVNIMDKRLQSLFEKYEGDVQKTADEYMRSIYDTPKAKAAIRENVLKQLETPVTRNFVVFPGEEEKVKILERKAEGGLVTDTDAIAAKLKSTGMDDQKAFMQALRMADARQEAHMAFGGLAKLGKGAKAADEAAKVAKPAKAAAKAEDVAKVAKPAKAEAPKPVAGPQAKALETARKNAVKMLGLPENNTAMDRAKAMGFGPVYHGTKTPEKIKNLIPGGTSESTRTGDAYGVGVYSTTEPFEASSYAGEGGVLPLMLRREGHLSVDNPTPEDLMRLSAMAGEQMLPSDKARFAIGRKTKQFENVEDAREFFANQRENWQHFGSGYDRARPDAIANPDGTFAVEFTDFDAPVPITSGEDANTLLKAVGWDTVPSMGYSGHTLNRGGGRQWDVTTDTSKLRSRFAAFDPARINESDLLGAADPALLAGVAVGSGLGLDAIRRFKKEEQKTEEQKKAKGGLTRRV